ncbi:hypothetical protein CAUPRSCDRAFT_12050 [Caulochytrium protostelioides]|uniref:Uncharacterized protein n=1 Tax=Caulochytrium protostelioides TaxID=1555241 RepID=A0A4V1IT93_9FUNG|nr:hypothetical protein CAUPRSCDRAFT_12050 [Caulochytrium protostelioides]
MNRARPEWLDDEGQRSSHAAERPRSVLTSARHGARIKVASTKSSRDGPCTPLSLPANAHHTVSKSTCDPVDRQSPEAGALTVSTLMAASDRARQDRYREGGTRPKHGAVETARPPRRGRR